jgi:hypothetical protein
MSSKSYIKAFLLFCLGAIFSLASVAGEEETDSAGSSGEAADTVAADTIFMELHVTPEGIYAVDSLGEEWEYDFSRDSFIRGGETTQGTKTVFGRKRKITPPDEELIEIPELPEELPYMSTKSLRGLKLGSVVVDVDDKVKGPIVAVGPVTVRGLVIGDVTSYKKITVTSTGKIVGDARAPVIEKMRGGIITGLRHETDLPSIPEFELVRESSVTPLIVIIIKLIALLICALVAVAIAPKAVERTKACLQMSFVRSFLVGLLAWFAYVPVFGLLCLTIIGIPVALVALPLATAVASILGFVGLSQITGEKSSRFIGRTNGSQLSRIILGILALESLWIIMSLFFASSSGVSQGFATFFMVMAIIVWSIGVTSGIGAVILTRFGTRVCRKVASPSGIASTVKPPPPPTPPPLSTAEDNNK